MRSARFILCCALFLGDGHCHGYAKRKAGGQVTDSQGDGDDGVCTDLQEGGDDGVSTNLQELCWEMRGFSMGWLDRNRARR
jgi:hypothetical protein